ncbi:hypothetical protein [Halalkalicoccus jeotgali]|uniref:Uncharacterized protein n=1 Tax=Halalkalicoccus jeotgali (strain DSM 18796 / CECT 7217 / JCM 14584 / KCTC 4019 / B3) TaxID=795797 RepID=D8J6F2_HALJB|nr:hypothetical protein [Halalkalicoccus jeotgali]ADJ15870.1 hypothetical protein HacjB3_12445 [Halalkalicoccus jeotgali B3]ELY37966.1 hypothetical protein C497_07639 [Halalkalicoccus jeotgali B3]
MVGWNAGVGALVGSVIGALAAMSFGPSGWVLGGGVAGLVVGASSPDLAAALFHGAGSGGFAGLAFAIVFGFGIGVRLALASGDLALLAWGLNPFFAVAIVYGVGCAVIASVTGGLAYWLRRDLRARFVG